MENLIRNTALRSAYLGTKVFESISPEITGKLGTFLWFTPLKKGPHKDLSKLKSLSEIQKISFKDSYITIRNFNKSGTGTRLVLIHGWGGRWDQYSELITYLIQQGHPVTCFDFPAHGESKGLSTNLREWYEVLMKVEALFNDRPLYVCHSFGAIAVTHAILEMNLRAEGIVLVNSPNQFDFLVNQFTKKIRLNNKAVPHLIKNVLATVQGADAMITIPLRKLHAKLPVLYVADETDREVPFALHTEAKEIFGENFVTFKNFGHNRILSAKEFHQALENFYAKKITDRSL
ncbi:alpha/beta hydrolase [Peredibacter sp. HCB2-198]|uniref:alpha/beta hydrolase n=1 Tax=Peredibacter sp. HCB2-198 TaxID=3383025 RepID=UPI0038B44089